ncbi:MAG: helix-turn-helix domain-containing protein, partial [Solirubrobacteraceae bacterium]
MSELGRSLIGQLDAADLELLATRLRELAPLPRPVSESRPLLTPAEAAARATVHVETIRRAVRSGALKARRAGRATRIDPEDLAAWLTRTADRSDGCSAMRP